MKSVFQEEKKCYFSESPNVHDHHIFNGPFRKKSERYGYKVYLRHDLHIYGKESVHENPGGKLDTILKRMAQEHFLSHHGSKEDFINEFGKNYL